MLLTFMNASNHHVTVSQGIPPASFEPEGKATYNNNNGRDMEMFSLYVPHASIEQLTLHNCFYLSDFIADGEKLKGKKMKAA